MATDGDGNALRPEESELQNEELEAPEESEGSQNTVNHPPRLTVRVTDNALSSKYPRFRPSDAIVDASKVAHWKQTQAEVAELERQLGARVVLLFIHSGFSLSIGEVTEIYNHLAIIGRQEKLAVVIQGLGGSPFAAYRALRLFRRFTDKLIVVVPGDAASALTMFALGADEILVGPLSSFSPTDISLANHPLAPRDSSGNPVSVENFQIKKYLDLVHADKHGDTLDFRMTPYHALSEKVHPIVLGSIQRSLSLSKMLMTAILTSHLTDNAMIQKIVDHLNDDFPSHNYPITGDDLSAMGLNVTELTDDANTAALDLCRSTQQFATTFYSDVTSNSRKYISRASVIESLELRSWFSRENNESLVDSKWIVTKPWAGYSRAAVAKTKRGYYEARALTNDQFNSFLDGETVEVD